MSLFQVDSSPLTREEECASLVSYRNNKDNKALNKLIAHGFSTVVNQAHKFSNFNVDFYDLMQEGLIGLLEAIKKFNINREVRLLSYARMLIRHRMMVHAAEFHISVNLNPAFRAKSFKKDDFKEINTLKNVSIDKMSEAANISNPEDVYGKKELKSVVLDLVDNCLNDTQKTIICKRVLSENPETLSSIGKDISITGERVRQIEAKAFEIIRDRIETVKGLRSSILGE